jgi:hypothetical protein
MIFLSIGGGVLLLALVLTLLLVDIGDSPKTVMRDWLAGEDERLKMLESMTDESSIEAGLPRLIENNTRLAGVYQRMVDVPVARNQVDTEESRKFRTELFSIEHQQSIEKDRIWGIRGGPSILSKAARDRRQKISEIPGGHEYRP